jgi:hypothetical protein
LFIAAGISPFILLLPLASRTPPLPDGPIGTAQLFSGIFSGDLLLVAATIGLVASFLSAFNSGLLTSVQLGLILQRLRAPKVSETSRFHWLMGCALGTIFLLFVELRVVGNPYLLANVLLGPYALVAGIIVATRFSLGTLPRISALWILAIGSVGWFSYFVSYVRHPSVPSTFEVNTVPGGALLFVATFALCRLLMLGKRRYA